MLLYSINIFLNMSQFTIKSCLERAEKMLTHSPSACFDAEVLLAHILKKNRAFLKAFPETILTTSDSGNFFSLIEERAKGKPVAYLTGTQDFWSLSFAVSPDVLIPRSETELIVEYVLAHYSATTPLKLLDLGTGSGAIAVSIAKARPTWQLVATDISPRALAIAKQNAHLHGCVNVHFVLSDWYQSLDRNLFDIIVSNPPYIAHNDPHLEEMVKAYEPQSALIAENEGMDCLKKITHGATGYLKPHGLLMLEHGWQQADCVRKLMFDKFDSLKTLNDLQGLSRVTLGFLA